jgi:Protein of unknown function (DUF2863)
MRRNRIPARGRRSREIDHLVRLATGLSESGSRVEDGFWENRLTHVIDRLLEAGDDETFNSAFDQLYNKNSRAYDQLADLIEARCEGNSVETRGEAVEVLLIAAPIMAWSRFSIGSGAIPLDLLATLHVQLQAHVVAAEARLVLADFLFSPDQMPPGPGATRRLARRLGAAVADAQDLHINPAELPETLRFISDTRFLIGAIAAPRGRALFRWNEEDGSREQALSEWQTQSGPSIGALLPGCAAELLLPDAFYVAWRQADRQGRPFSLRASVAYLTTSLDVASERLRAVVAPFYEQEIEEYRIGFTLGPRDEVVHGVVWQLIGNEDESADGVNEITTVLNDCGVKDVIALEQRMPVEFCEDCGAPLYPNAEGEAVHAELPEHVAQSTMHLH